WIGQAMFAVQLGDTSQIGGGGVSVTAPAVTPPSAPGPHVAGPGGTGVMTPPPSPTPPVLTAAGSPSGPDPVGIPQPPIIRRSMGSKSGVNLLGDLERWAFPDNQKVTQATLTLNGVSIKELRDLCIK